MKILIIVPAYNEAENIKFVLDDLKEHFPKGDVLVVNDCSKDNTVDVLKNNKADYINLPINLGIGGGVQSGYKYAFSNNYDIAVQVDGDGQHDASYIGKIIEPIEKGDADFVVGSRFIEKEGFQSSVSRRLGINWLSREIKLLSGADIKDVTSGFRAANRKTFELFCENYAQDYPEPESLLFAAKKGMRIKEVAVKMRQRQSGVSSINPVKSVYYMLKVSIALLLP